MAQKHLRKSALVLPIAAVAAAPQVAEAATPLTQRAERQVQQLAEPFVNAKFGTGSIVISKSKNGQPIASYELEVDASSSKATSDKSTGHYLVKLVTAAKRGRPEPKKPLFLEIVAESSSSQGAADYVSVDYELSRKHGWTVTIDNVHSDPPSNPEPDTALGGAYWGESHQATTQPGSLPETQTTLDEASQLAELVMGGLNQAKPIGDLPRHRPNLS